MDVQISLVGRKDLSGEIYRQLRRAILDGRFRLDEPLPPSRELAESLNVARATVTIAYERLAGEGLVYSRMGAGTFVAVKATRHEPASFRDGGALHPRRIWKRIPLPRLFDQPPEFDFRSGIPDVSLFPHEKWRRAMARAMRAESFASGVYGQYAGLPQLREAIARHIGIARSVDADAEDVTITAGTQQAMDVVGRVLLARGDLVAMEDPGYPPPRRLFETLGIRVAGVRVDDEGLVVGSLPARARMVYVTPSHQYPLGMPMSLSRRLALLDWADRHGAAIVEDDYDCEFRFGGRPIEPLKSLDRAGRVLYIGSFSKTLLPGLRLGFIIAPPTLRDAIHRAKWTMDWHSSMVAQATLALFIEEGEFARHVSRCHKIYRERHAVLVDTIRKSFRGRLELVPSSAGLHVAAMARDLSPTAIREVAKRAEALGVALQDLALFSINQPKPAGLLLAYGGVTAERIPAGLRILKRCFEAVERQRGG